MARSSGHRARQICSTTARFRRTESTLIKLDVEGVEIEAIKGGARLLQGDSVLLCVDYTLIDCGANYGYWSVLVSSAPYGSHKAIAIEPSSQNFTKLKNNAEINGNRFEVMKCAIGASRGTARLSGTKHEAFSIAGDAGDGGEDVPVIALDNLLDDGKVSPNGKYLIKLDVEGVEIEAIKGGARLLQGDSVCCARNTATIPTIRCRAISSSRPRSS